ncbi:MAG: glutathione S-transferase family protein [Pseudomonadales bacterium]
MKVHGFDISNYYNIVKQVALETDFAFEPVPVTPNNKEEFLPISPMGKIPAAETEFGALAETRAILTFMRETLGDSPLFPSSPWDMARSDELMSILDLYIESQARRQLAEAVFNGERDERAHQEVPGAVARGMTALGRRAKLSPYMLGEQYSVVDIYAFWTLFLARTIMQGIHDTDILESVEGLSDWYDLVASKESTAKIAESQSAAMQAMAGG